MEADQSEAIIGGVLAALDAANWEAQPLRVVISFSNGDAALLPCVAPLSGALDVNAARSLELNDGTMLVFDDNMCVLLRGQNLGVLHRCQIPSSTTSLYITAEGTHPPLPDHTSDDDEIFHLDL